MLKIGLLLLVLIFFYLLTSKMCCNILKGSSYLFLLKQRTLKITYFPLEGATEANDFCVVAF